MTKPSQDDLPSALTKTLISSDLPAVAIDLSEVALDTLINEGVYRDLPVLSTLVGIVRTGAAVRDAMFVRKLVAFLANIDKTTPDQRREMVESLEDPSTEEKVGEKLINLLDRFESSMKAGLLGRAYSAYIARKITRDEFWRVSFVIERLPMTDIVALSSWRSVELDHVEHVRKHLYLSAGIGWFVLDASSTGFQWQERLCSIFADILLNTPRQADTPNAAGGT